MSTLKRLLKREVDVKQKFGPKTRKVYNLDGRTFLSVSCSDVLHGKRGLGAFNIVAKNEFEKRPGAGIHCNSVTFIDSETGNSIGVAGTTRKQFGSGLRSYVINYTAEEALEKEEVAARKAFTLKRDRWETVWHVEKIKLLDLNGLQISRISNGGVDDQGRISVKYGDDGTGFPFDILLNTPDDVLVWLQKSTK